MDFGLSFVQAQVQESTRRMLEDRLSTQQIREAEESADGFPRPIWDEGIQLGWPGMSLPEAFGGGGCSLLDMCVLVEEVGRGGATLPLVVSSGVAATLLEHSPQSELRDWVLSEIAAGKIVCPALIDEHGRNEWDEVRLPISADGQLSGKKILVPFASVADELLVTAVTPDGDTTIVVVDPNTEGVSITRHHTKVGLPLFAVEFNDVLVAAEIHRGEGAQTALDAGLQTGSLLATAEAVGTSEALIKMSAEYVTVRKAFGQPIGAFQAVAHPCADMRINTDTVRLLVHEAAWLIGTGQDASEEVASTKALANEFFERLANDAFRVHGAIGYSNEYDLQLYTRRLQGFCRTMGETQESLERAAVALGI
ncbi:MAG: acyl-CoA dehydrogenase [Gammaproteobacteria bacterium]|nr:acyl-CoA dehydrogenase [Gammaproteobacteria bacterium]MYH16325.1 acyl-CoA dehydrogenase [Gammaproteobacteria bacterium]MYK81611.1 acyl-CoA dehydrogenase [Gammaproteobacteria bacterium]